MKHFGLLITKDDETILGDWLAENVRFFDEIVCLDGSGSDASRQLVNRYPQVHYMHERQQFLPYRTDHGLRWAAHRELVDRHGYQGWITLCHADEFFYHDPRKCVERAEAEGCDSLWWYALHFLPHPDEWERREELQQLPPSQRFCHFHWGLPEYDEPWREFRSFRNAPGLSWELPRHGNTRCHGLQQEAPFCPVYRHFKVFELDLSFYQAQDSHTLFQRHWQGVEQGRTGLPFAVQEVRDLFVDHYPPYRHCQRFDGRLDQPWNIGEDFR